MDRRGFLQSVAAAFVATQSQHLKPLSATADDNLYNVPNFGNARILHTCDVHAQLLPIVYREPNVNLGFGVFEGVQPHIVGEHLLKKFAIEPNSALAYALTYNNIDELVDKYGRMGGYAHLATLVSQLRSAVKAGGSLHLDSGDLWHGSATSLYTQGNDMVQASNLMGIDAMVGHWEYTFPASTVRQNIANFNGEFISHNVRVKEESLFDGAEAYDEDIGWAFKPYTIREVGGNKIAIIGQSFPYTAISNPQRFIPDWTFGIRPDDMQELVDNIRQNEKVAAVILLSHNGSDLDASVARRVNGIDFILGGHTHDVFYQAQVINNTVIVNSGCMGKVLGCLDIDIKNNKVIGYRWHAVPVFANLLPADQTMQAHIDTVRAPYQKQLSEVLATTDQLLYRRGNFNGTIDQIIVDALCDYYDTDIALSPGFRWGSSIPAGNITMEDVMNMTAMTYPETYSREMKGSDIKLILEDIADNLYHEDPYYQQGGDMVRLGGLNYTLHPQAKSGNRISELRLDDGRLLDANTSYTVSGWATANLSEGPPIWEIVRDYLRAQQTVSIERFNQPKLKGVAGNVGIADYPPELLL